MKRKKLFFSIGTTILLLLTLTPSIHSKMIIKNESDISLKHFIPEKNNGFISNVKMKIYSFGNNGQFKKVVKKISVDEKEELMSQLYEVAQSDLSLKQKFEEELSKLKEHNLIPTDTKLEDFIDTEYFENTSPRLDIETVMGENFMAHFAPIFVIGGGFGIGLGLQQRYFNGFTHFLAIIGGLGAVFCLDPIEGKLYTLMSYLLPLLIGYFAGYMGFIIFAVQPGLLYSNLVMLGFTPLTMWIQIPSIE